MNFANTDNLEYIKMEIDYLNKMTSNNTHEVQVRKAVVCFDLGEFARYVKGGRTFLEFNNAKTQLSSIMADANASPELKKEAITAYQKILMKSWGQ